MSCSSPFSYVAYSDGSYQSVPYTLGFVGSYTLQGYSIPGYSLCALGWNAAHIEWGSCCGGGCVCNCGWGGWRNTVLSCSWCNCCSTNNHCNVGWVSGSHYWYNCSQVPSIPVFPTLNMSASANIPMSFELEEDVELSLEGPSVIVTSSIVVESVDIILTINNTDFTISVPSNNLPITISANSNGQFSATIPIYTFTDDTTIDGYGYNITIGSSFLFCADPVAPQGWANLQLAAAFSITALGANIYNTSFTVACPLASIETPVPVE